MGTKYRELLILYSCINFIFLHFLKQCNSKLCISFKISVRKKLSTIYLYFKKGCRCSGNLAFVF